MADKTENFDSDSPKEANFSRATLTDCNFEGATFTERADFGGATIKGVNFVDATFTRGAHFEGATFPKWATFKGATFTQGATFAGATFTERVNFGGATFTGEADFGGATFAEEADFGGATFAEAVAFVNAEMKGETSFSGATFASEPPRFFGAKLHEGTVWRDVIWPDPPKHPQEAGRFVDAYERLKLEMDRLKKHEDELDFFARELRCRRVLQGIWRGLPIAIYGALSDYGRSYIRPLSVLLVTVAVGAAPFWAHLGAVTVRPFAYTGHAREAIGLSFANTFSVLGIRKDLIAAKVLEDLPGWLKVIATAQTALGIVLLFLFGLGIRNRFRMK